MKNLFTVLGVMALGWAAGASAQVQFAPDAPPQRVFGGAVRTIRSTWKNTGGTTVAAELDARICQASSATAVRLSESRWKRLELLPRQTVLETAELEFPLVKAETRFLVQWVASSNQVLGTSEVWVYPAGPLKTLKELSPGEDIGVLDPENQLKPLLTQSEVVYQDLETAEPEDFQGRLAILGPFESRAAPRGTLVRTVLKLAARGVAVVWLQPPPAPKAEIKPSFQVLSGNKGAVVIVQPDVVADLAENPKAQLNLVYFCRLALNPGSFPSPTLAP